MSKHIQGQNVNLLIGGSVVAASESCDFNLTANTVDSTAKDDPGLGEWDNPQFDNYSWSCSNSSFLVDISYLSTLLIYVISGDATVGVSFNVACGTNKKKYTGNAIITSLDIDAPNDGFVKVSISLEGNSVLTEGTGESVPAAGSLLARIKGKALMCAVKTGSGDSATYTTAMCATGHKLTVSIQTSDVSDKDENDNFKDKEVTGRSIKLTTDNLVPTYSSSDTGVGYTDFISKLMNGTDVTLSFGYHSSAIGATATNHNWGAADSAIVQGTFICTSFSMNAQVKQNVTWNAEFTGKGAPSIVAPRPRGSE